MLEIIFTFNLNQYSHYCYQSELIDWLVFNANFSNISAISWGELAEILLFWIETQRVRSNK